MPHPTVLRGVVHGNTIQLDQAPDLPEGQQVKVIVHVMLSVLALRLVCLVSPDGRHAIFGERRQARAGRTSSGGATRAASAE